jgi:hypothetical protein
MGCATIAYTCTFVTADLTSYATQAQKIISTAART